ncbi:putative nicotinate-nucleotide adenylyltransferase [mine drainage metagenome]|uniref:Putative nicotinate-nucleotide adenylyltransferase n=1 Tax=mine drainage metagenome TaxID=410659 RepID=A0A1J5RKA9_9ZZZZ
MALPPNPWGDRLRRRVGLLGGSFNPAHDGHRHISLAALAALGLDEVWWLVSPQNPLKAARDMAPLAARLARARARARHPAIRVTGLESRLATRYTADTLAALCRRFPARRFVWLMGADNLAQFPRWERWEQIFHRVPIAVFDRSPYSFQALAGKAGTRFRSSRRPPRRARLLAADPPPAWVFLHQRRHPASATALRRQGLSPDFVHA